MVIYNIKTNGSSSELIIEIINDAVSIESNAVAYVEGDLELDGNQGTVRDRIKAFFIGKKFFKPVYKGTGKIYTKPTLGNYHKFNVKDTDNLIINNNAFIACRQSIKLIPQFNPSLIKFLSGSPMVENLVKGTGSVVVRMSGPVEELQLTNGKFVAYSKDIAAYSASLKVTRESPGKGWLNIVQQLVRIYRGSGIVYFTPHPNKDSKSNS
jgi:uncharacterized protein (AIM24 family)